MSQPRSLRAAGDYQLPGRGKSHSSNLLALSSDAALLAAALSAQVFFLLRRDLQLPRARRELRAGVRTPGAVNLVCLLRPFGADFFCLSTSEDAVLLFEVSRVLEGARPPCHSIYNRRRALPGAGYAGTWSLAHLPGREWLLAGSNLRCVNIYQLRRKRDGLAHAFIAALPLAHNAPALSPSPCGRFVAAACADGSVTVFGAEGQRACFGGESTMWGAQWLPRRARPRGLADYSLLATSAKALRRLGGGGPQLYVEESFDVARWSHAAYFQDHLPEHRLLVFYLGAGRLLLARYDRRGALSFAELNDPRAAELVGLRAAVVAGDLLLFALYMSGLCSCYRVQFS